MMNISPIVNSVKCTFFACIVHFLHVLEGSTAYVRTVDYQVRTYLNVKILDLSHYRVYRHKYVGTIVIQSLTI